MERSGYIVGSFDIEEVFEHSAVRYACTTHEGGSFAAFDAVEPSDIQWFKMLGKVYLELSEPDYPDTWPDWARPTRGPKRKVANGMERFALVSATTGRLLLEEGLVVASLVECDLQPYAMVEY